MDNYKNHLGHKPILQDSSHLPADPDPLGSQYDQRFLDHYNSLEREDELRAEAFFWPHNAQSFSAIQQDFEMATDLDICTEQQYHQQLDQEQTEERLLNHYNSLERQEESFPN